VWTSPNGLYHEGKTLDLLGSTNTINLTVTSLDNAYSDAITIQVKTDPGATTDCGKNRAVRVNGSSSYSVEISVGESITLSPPEGAPGSFEWYRSDKLASNVNISHAEDVVVSPTIDTTYWVVNRYTAGGVTKEERSANFYVIITPSTTPSVRIEPRFQAIPADAEAVIEVIDDAATDGNYDDYTFEWNAGNDNTRPSVLLPWPYRRLILENLHDDASFWCRVTDPNDNVTITDVATVAVTCSDGIGGSMRVTPGNYVSRTDRPLLSVSAWGKQLRYDWYERLPEETTPRLYYKHASSIYATLSQPLTYYSATIQDVCGQTASFAEVPVYLCMPTVDAEPVDQVVPRGGSASLTVAASPAIAGQPVAIAWRSGETGQVVGSGPALSFTPAPGTTQTFYADVSADCSGTTRSVQTRTATVTGCELAATAYSDRNIAPGQTSTFTAAFSGTLVPPSEVEYTWYYGPAPGTEYVSGIGLWSITPTPQTTTTYWVRVNDGTCTAQSNLVTVRICVPVITSQPQGATLRAGRRRASPSASCR